MSVNLRLARLLEHPALWRGRSAARVPTWSTGYPVLDAGLPGGGWPRAGLVEILTPQPGVGELVAEQVGGAHLVPGQLRMGVDITADAHQLAVELGQRRLERG